MYRTIKKWGGFPCAHRQYKHNGHCAFVHGYDIHFTAEFEASQIDGAGFVVDFGCLRSVRDDLYWQFDHCLLIQEGDPLRLLFEQLEAEGGCKLRVMESISMESRAKWLFDRLRDMYSLPVVKVTCAENERNSASYTENNKK